MSYGTRAQPLEVDFFAAVATEWQPQRNKNRKKPDFSGFSWLRGQDLNL
jgi:hypothetical protein